MITKQPPRTPCQRVKALRERRAALGLMQLNVYAHRDDHAAIRTLAKQLERKRALTAK